jgi:myo-inositol 2-dehydrogenase / D-chiro-inositol 1-dehydrogenase
MYRVGIVGGETHVGEVTKLAGGQLEIVAAAVRPEQTEEAMEAFGCPVVEDYHELLANPELDIVAVANENDRRAEVIVAAIAAGKDVICDKPLALTMAEQDAIEETVAANPQRRVLNLLTLRGQPIWRALREVLNCGRIGSPAFTHVRMAVRLKRDERPPWFLDARRSGGLFLDLLIHGLDQVEWVTGRQITAMTATTGNLGEPDEQHLRDHAAVFCEMEDGSAALCEGQRMLPDTKGADYRVTVAGTSGYADLYAGESKLMVTDMGAADQEVTELSEELSVVADWLGGGDVVPQVASLRANRLAIVATMSATRHERMEI